MDARTPPLAQVMRSRSRSPSVDGAALDSAITRWDSKPLQRPRRAEPGCYVRVAERRFHAPVKSMPIQDRRARRSDQSIIGTGANLHSHAATPGDRQHGHAAWSRPLSAVGFRPPPPPGPGCRGARPASATLAFAPLLGHSQPAAPAARYALSAEDDAFLEDLSRRAFMFFWEQADPQTGIVRDRSRTDGTPAGTLLSMMIATL